jgi:hypothetical protein
MLSDNFSAACVSVEEGKSRWFVGFADAEFNAKRYLVLQRERCPQDQDVVLGLSGYHIEVDDQGQSCYGGIKCFELFFDQVVVEFDDDALSTFGGQKVIVASFTLHQRQFDELRVCLGKIFKGYECFPDRDLSDFEAFSSSTDRSKRAHAKEIAWFPNPR